MEKDLLTFSEQGISDGKGNFVVFGKNGAPSSVRLNNGVECVPDAQLGEMRLERAVVEGGSEYKKEHATVLGSLLGDLGVKENPPNAEDVLRQGISAPANFIPSLCDTASRRP